MASNTVEATLRSKFEDGISKGVKQTQAVLDQTFSAMTSSGAVLGSGIQRVFEGMLGHLQRWREQLSQSANESESGFRRIGLGSAAMALAVAVGIAGAIKALGGFLIELSKEASTITELKVAFEGLVGSGAKASALLKELKAATEGLVGTTDILRNANRVLSSGIPLTSEQYVRLTENISRLAKASGTDLTQALTATTDALIRGNARGLQAIGIHINVKDAVSQLAVQMGMGANAMADLTKLQVFYLELLEKTDAAVRKLPPGMITLEDASIRVERAWRGYLLTFGEAVNRSGVVQEVLNRITLRLLTLAAGGKDVDELSLAVNRFIISAVRGFASFMEVLSVFSYIWDTVWGAVKLVVYSAGSLIADTLFMILKGIVLLAEAGAKLPGVVGNQFEAIIPSLKAMEKWIGVAQSTYKEGVKGAFSGFGEGAKKAQEMASSARQLAADLETYSGTVLTGARGTKQQGDAAGDAAANQQKLNEQLKTYHDLLVQISLRNATPEERAAAQFTADWEAIEKLTMIGTERRAALQRAAQDAYIRSLEEIDRKAEEETRQHQLAMGEMELEGQQRRAKQMIAFLDLIYLAPVKAQAEAERKAKDEAQKAASATEAMARAIELSRKGKIGRNVGSDALQYQAELERTMRTRLDELNSRPNRSMEDINEIVRLSTELEKLQRMNLSPLGRQIAELGEQASRLNELKMDGFRGVLQALKDNVIEFASQAGQAFSAFFSDLVSGQENSAKKFLAAFLGMIGQVITNVGVMMLTLGTAELLASWGFGVWAGGANPAHAKAMIVKGAALAALGGIMQGAASGLAGTNQAGAGGSFQENVPRPTSANQVQVIQVGAAGRAQNPGQASQPQVYGELRVKVEPPKGWVVSEIKDAYRNNNATLRTVIQNA